MKPRRWYSSPEVKPLPPSLSARPFPAAIYWAFTALTRLEQGSIIKSAPPAPPATPHGRESAARASAPRVRLIDAA
ncbi:MAG: hypothetical protein HGA45_17195 [Chloroflexales bacterium]|nr:hypothetical protein [Chloroflexales bacterium]